MKAVIYLDVPEWQVDQDVTIFFPDTMVQHAKCELLKEEKEEEKMKWEKFEQMNPVEELFFINKVQTNIECPKCGKKLYFRTDITLTSYPEQYEYECECGFVGYSHIRWTDEWCLEHKRAMR